MTDNSKISIRLLDDKYHLTNLEKEMIEAALSLEKAVGRGEGIDEMIGIYSKHNK